MSENSFSIKQWNPDDRPREKLLIKGREALSDAELIAILIGSGNRNESAVQLARRILAHSGNDLNRLGKLGIEQLQDFRGIGQAKAISIIAALELSRRSLRNAVPKQPQVLNSSWAFEVFKSHIADLPHEEFWVAYLNHSNRVIRTAQLSKGGITGTLVDVRLLIKKALDLHATALILAHNHPSGALQPSEADKQLTLKIKNALGSLDIKLLDHLIVTENGYFSFADEGHL